MLKDYEYDCYCLQALIKVLQELKFELIDDATIQHMERIATSVESSFGKCPGVRKQIMSTICFVNSLLRWE
jgi:hypothetical protein